MLPLWANCKRQVHFLERLEGEGNCSKMPRKGTTFTILRMHAESREAQLKAQKCHHEREIRVWFFRVTRSSSSQFFLNSKLWRNHEGFCPPRACPPHQQKAAHSTGLPSRQSPSHTPLPQQQHPPPCPQHRMHNSILLSNNRHHRADDTWEPEVALQEAERLSPPERQKRDPSEAERQTLSLCIILCFKLCYWWQYQHESVIERTLKVCFAWISVLCSKH